MELRTNRKGFNYCKVAKTIVAIPALPIIAMTAGSCFIDPAVQFMAALASVVAAVGGAIWLDSIPLLQKKVRNVNVVEKELWG